MSFTWRVFNESTMLPVVEADVESTLTEDEARREACAFLIAEADGDADADNAELLDAAAQDLNLGKSASVGGPFEWSVEILPTWAVEG